MGQKSKQTEIKRFYTIGINIAKASTGYHSGRDIARNQNDVPAFRTPPLPRPGRPRSASFTLLLSGFTRNALNFSFHQGGL